MTDAHGGKPYSVKHDKVIAHFILMFITQSVRTYENIN